MVSPSLSVTFSRLEHSENALTPIVLIEAGIVTDTIDVFFAKALLLIAITGLPSISEGITTAVSLPW